MSDREKVVRGLECIGGYRHMESNPCAECGYNECQTFAICIGEVARDALELLKEQEPLAVYEGKVNKCVCGNEINRYYHPKYCGYCGKELMWY